MVKNMIALIWVFVGNLIQVVESYYCTYFNRHGVLIYVHCPYSECCGNYHYRYCCSYYNVGAIVGGVFGFLLFVGLIAGCISCFFCACCPIYRQRNGYVITRGVPNYSSTAATTAHVASQPYQSVVVTRTQDGVSTTPPPAYKP